MVFKVIVLLLVVESSLTVDLAVPELPQIYEPPSVFRPEQTSHGNQGSPTNMNQQQPKPVLHIPVLKTPGKTAGGVNQLHVPQYVLSPQDFQGPLTRLSPDNSGSSQGIETQNRQQTQPAFRVPSLRVLDGTAGGVNQLGKPKLLPGTQHLQPDAQAPLAIPDLPYGNDALLPPVKDRFQVPKDSFEDVKEPSPAELTGYNVQDNTVAAKNEGIFSNENQFDSLSDFSESSSVSEYESDLESSYESVQSSDSMSYYSILNKLGVGGIDSDGSDVGDGSDLSFLGWGSDESGSDSNEGSWGEWDESGERISDGDHDGSDEGPFIPDASQPRTKLQPMGKGSKDVDIIGGKSLALYSVPLLLLCILIFLVWRNRYFHRTTRVVAVDPESRNPDYKEPLLREAMMYKDEVY